MERDPKSGRFLPGNKAAVGNKGNRNPKWGNKNAKKHGFFCTFTVPKVLDDGRLRLYKIGLNPVVIGPEGYVIDAEGAIWINQEIINELKKRGYVPDWPF